MDQILSMVLSVQFVALVFVIVLLRSSIKFVPQNRAWLIERFGKYNATKEAGLNFIVPFIDKVAADRSLKEQAVDVPSQSAITKDNITLSVDGVLYFRVLDPYKATYGVDNYVFAVTQLAQTTMRSELGKMELDKTFEERNQLNTNIVSSINEAAEPWGIQVMRYEIKDIVPPQSVMQSMEAQMKAERVKRAQILGVGSVSRAQLADAIALAARGIVTPQVSRVLPLSEVGQAHEIVEGGAASGRVVLKP